MDTSRPPYFARHLQNVAELIPNSRHNSGTGLPPAAYYGWLALYNVIYILPLLAITLVFTFTLGARKLSEAEGRLLKLVSGLMMLALGVLLVLRPDALNHLGVALGLPVVAVALSTLIHRTWKNVSRD